MILYPAIDLKDGQCVRLLRGEMSAATVFGDDPAAQAAKFQAAGCEWLHLVDLNGAFAGTPVNAAAVEAILARLTVPAQLGGGIRDMATIAMWLEKGLARVILGTVRSRTRRSCARPPAPSPAGSPSASTRAGSRRHQGLGDRDRRDGHRPCPELPGRGRRRDHLHRHRPRRRHAGPDIEATEALARAVTIPVIASGGVSRMEDLLALRDTGVIAGAISGRALYDGAIDLRQASRRSGPDTRARPRASPSVGRGWGWGARGRSSGTCPE